jgi:WD40 repeat protein
MGSALGTPAYMSPEQASGRWNEVGPPSDVYSLGATLYVLLTGRPAFQNLSRSALLDQVRCGDFPPPRQVKTDVPPALAAVCRKAMALRRGDRYPGAAELATDLERWLADEPVTAWREPARVRLGRWMRRHAALVAGSAALAATALIALAVGVWLLGQEQTKTERALDDSQKNYRLARTAMADVQTSFGLAAGDRGAPAEAALWFTEAAATGDLDPERVASNRIRARDWSLQSPTPVAAFWPPPNAKKPVIRTVAFDPQGRYLVTVGFTGGYLILDVPEDRPVLLPGAGRAVYSAAWKDGNTLALGTIKGDVELIHIPDGKVLERLHRQGPVNSLEFSRDGKLLALGADQPWVWDLQRKAYRVPELLHPGRAVRLAFNPQADRLAIAKVDGRIRVYDLSTERAAPLFTTEPSPLTGTRSDGRTPIQPLFVGRGRGILTVPSAQELVWLDATTGATIRRLETVSMNIKDLFLSPDGTAIVAVGEGGVKIWDAGSGRALFGFGDADALAAAFTADGSELLIANYHYDLAPCGFPGGERGRWTLRHPDQASQIAVGPNGQYFALAQWDGLVSLWRFPDRASSARPGGASPTQRLAMSPDGRLVMPLGLELHRGPTSTHVEDWKSGRRSPALSVDGILHGGAISPDGRHVVTLSSPARRPQAGTSDDEGGGLKGSIQFWNWEQGTRVGPPIETPTEPIAAEYTPDGRQLIVLGALGELFRVDPTKGELVPLRKEEKVDYSLYPLREFLRLSPDGKLVARWGQWPLVLIDATTGAEHSPSSLPLDWVLDAQFSRDGRYLAVGRGGGRTAQVCDLSTGKPAAPPLVHPDWVFKVAFSTDGSRLLTACRDGNARVWDWKNGRLDGPILSHPGEVQDVRFLNADRWVLTKSSDKPWAHSTDNAVQIWDRRLGQPLTARHLVASGWQTQLCLMPDERHAAIGSYTDKINILNFDEWLDGNDPRFAPEHLREITELFSGQRIVGGGGAVNLTTEEWAERWQSYRKYRGVGAPATQR